MDIPYFVYPFITDGYLGGFYFLAIMSSAVVNIVYEFLCGHVFNSLRYVCRSGIAGSCDT